MWSQSHQRPFTGKDFQVPWRQLHPDFPLARIVTDDGPFDAYSRGEGGMSDLTEGLQFRFLP